MSEAPTKPTKLTLGDAIDQYESSKRAIDGLTPLLNEAKNFLIAHGEKTGKRTFKDRVAMVATGGNLTLDQQKAIEFLLAHGERIEDYQTRSKRGWTLKLLH